jgi:hypothetical protein
MSAVLCGRSVTEGNDLIGGFGPFESPGKTVTSPNMSVHASQSTIELNQGLDQLAG